MNRRLAAVALAVVLVGGSVVVLVADPLASQPDPSTIEATAESPGELVLEALETPERRSYAVTYTARRSSVEGTYLQRVRVDRERRRVIATEPRASVGEPTVQRFLGECNSVLRVGTASRGDHHDYGDYPAPFSSGGVEPTDLEATVVDRTDDRVVVRVTNTSAAVSLAMGRVDPREWVRTEDVRGNLTVVWDADEGVLDRIEYVHSSRVNETHRETHRRTWDFQSWGQVNVDRPGWAGYTRDEFVCDVRKFRT